MANYIVKEGSLTEIAPGKFGMTVTFNADDGRSVTCYHEVEGKIDQSLNAALGEFNSRVIPVSPDLSSVVVGEAVEMEEAEPEICQGQ